MTQPVRLNRKVVLASSSNKCLSYPVAGTLETAELASDGSIIWATFRGEGKGACPVVVRNIQTQ